MRKIKKINPNCTKMRKIKKSFFKMLIIKKINPKKVEQISKKEK